MDERQVKLEHKSNLESHGKGYVVVGLYICQPCYGSYIRRPRAAAVDRPRPREPPTSSNGAAAPPSLLPTARRTLPTMGVAARAAAVTDTPAKLGGTFLFGTPAPLPRAAAPPGATTSTPAVSAPASASPTHPGRSSVIARNYDKARRTQMHADPKTPSDHAFNALMECTDVVTFVKLCRDFNRLVLTDDVLRLLNKASHASVQQAAARANAAAAAAARVVPAMPVTRGAVVAATATTASVVDAVPTAASASSSSARGRKRAPTDVEVPAGKAQAVVQAATQSADIFTYASLKSLQTDISGVAGLRFRALKRGSNVTRGDPLLSASASPRAFFLIIAVVVHVYCCYFFVSILSLPT